MQAMFIKIDLVTLREWGTGHWFSSILHLNKRRIEILRHGLVHRREWVTKTGSQNIIGQKQI